MKGERARVQRDLEETEKKLLGLRRDSQNIEQAQKIIQIVAQQTQEEFQFHLSDMVTMALEAVFGRSYIFKVSFIIKRNKTEAEIALFTKDGDQVDPMTEVGGGVVDITAFAIRVALWALSPSHPTIVLDEPFRFLSRDFQPKAGQLLHDLSEKLGLQFIMVTHNPDLVEASDRVFEVVNQNGVSRIIEK